MGLGRGARDGVEGEGVGEGSGARVDALGGDGGLWLAHVLHPALQKRGSGIEGGQAAEKSRRVGGLGTGAGEGPPGGGCGGCGRRLGMLGARAPALTRAAPHRAGTPDNNTQPTPSNTHMRRTRNTNKHTHDTHTRNARRLLRRRTPAPT